MCAHPTSAAHSLSLASRFTTLLSLMLLVLRGFHAGQRGPHSVTPFHAQNFPGLARGYRKGEEEGLALPRPYCVRALLSPASAIPLHPRQPPGSWSSPGGQAWGVGGLTRAIFTSTLLPQTWLHPLLSARVPTQPPLLHPLPRPPRRSPAEEQLRELGADWVPETRLPWLDLAPGFARQVMKERGPDHDRVHVHPGLSRLTLRSLRVLEGGD